MAQIEVTSTPTGADIEIDGKFVGSTPSSLSLPVGEHEIVVKKPGFTVYDKKVAVSPATSTLPWSWLHNPNNSHQR